MLWKINHNDIRYMHTHTNKSKLGCVHVGSYAERIVYMVRDSHVYWLGAEHLIFESV